MMGIRRTARGSMIAKKLLNAVRIALLMLRKELISKRKLIKELNIMMKRGKLVRKSLNNLLLVLHHHSKPSVALRMHGVQDYEFSCNNTPNHCPVFSYASSKLRKHHNLLPCINFPLVVDQHHDLQTDHRVEVAATFNAAAAAVAATTTTNNNNNNEAAVVPPKTPDYQFNFQFDDGYDLAQGEQYCSRSLLSPFHVVVSDYLSEGEGDAIGNDQVDYQAEEFIKRFYEQLRTQSRTQLLQY